MPLQVEGSRSFVVGLGVRPHSGRLGFFAKLLGLVPIHGGEWEAVEERKELPKDKGT